MCDAMIFVVRGGRAKGVRGQKEGMSLASSYLGTSGGIWGVGAGLRARHGAPCPPASAAHVHPTTGI